MICEVLKTDNVLKGCNVLKTLLSLEECPCFNSENLFLQFKFCPSNIMVNFLLFISAIRQWFFDSIRIS